MNDLKSPQGDQYQHTRENDEIRQESDDGLEVQTKDEDWTPKRAVTLQPG